LKTESTFREGQEHKFQAEEGKTPGKNQRKDVKRADTRGMLNKAGKTAHSKKGKKTTEGGGVSGETTERGKGALRRHGEKKCDRPSRNNHP